MADDDALSSRGVEVHADAASRKEQAKANRNVRVMAHSMSGEAAPYARAA